MVKIRRGGEEEDMGERKEMAANEREKEDWADWEGQGMLTMKQKTKKSAPKTDQKEKDCAASEGPPRRRIIYKKNVQRNRFNALQPYLIRKKVEKTAEQGLVAQEDEKLRRRDGQDKAAKVMERR